MKGVRTNRTHGTIAKSVGIFLLCFSALFAEKNIYEPSFIAAEGSDLNDPNSPWSYSRSVETENWIIFWEPGFGSDPSKASGQYRIDMNALKEVAEKSFAFYVDSLKMVVKESSLTDQYKQMIFLVYSADWVAYGSGQDEKVGSLHVNPAAANTPSVVAHEIAHCFQYMTGADVAGGGYRYGFGSNGSGGNGFWEQVAQWMSFKVYPNEQFTTWDFSEYIQNNHKHILHETPRYANYFLPDYWTYKRGKTFMGELWRNARSPEDPVETYQRLNGITQQVFNDEMYEHGARLTTWDLPSIRSYGEIKIHVRDQVKMNQSNDQYWLIDSSICLENYGYNSIQLNVPSSATMVSVHFQGKAGARGFRSLNVDQGGWRFGFVALLDDGSRVYSDRASLNYAKGKNPEGSLSFTVPEHCSYLWLIVSGAPQKHWHHAWDDDDSNDEQWPYQVRFVNTNLLGEPNQTSMGTYVLKVSADAGGSVSPASGTVLSGTAQTITATPQSGYLFTGWSGDALGDDNPLTITMDRDKSIVAHFQAMPMNVLHYDLVMTPRSDYSAITVELSADSLAAWLGLSQTEIVSEFGQSIFYYGVDPDGSMDSNSTAHAPGHWFRGTGEMVAYGDQAYVYSELDINTLSVKIGQYPHRLKAGDSYTIRQALLYQKSPTDVRQVTLVFHLSIGDPTHLEPGSVFSFSGLDQNASLESFINAFLAQEKTSVHFYDLKGTRIGSLSVQNPRDWLRFPRNQVYLVVFQKAQSVQAVRTLWNQP